MSFSAPDDIWGLVMVLAFAVITAGGSIIGSLVITRNQTRHLENRHTALAGQVDEVRDQVANTHTTNLREDIDRIGIKVDVIDRRTQRIGEEIRTDRREVAALRSDLYRSSAKADRITAKYHPEEGES